MKKSIRLLTVSIVILSSCKKEKDIITPLNTNMNNTDTITNNNGGVTVLTPS